MKLSQIKNVLSTLETVTFQLPNGTFVPEHFHVTEVGIITKNALVLRDLDILKELAAQNLVHVAISITTLDSELQRRMEPRTSLPSKRLDAVQDQIKVLDEGSLQAWGQE